MKKENQTVLIIGGNSGMGLAAAQKAAGEGYRVIIAGRSEEKLALAEKSISAKIHSFTVDTTNTTSIQQLFEHVGKVHHLVISASEVLFGNIQNSSLNDVKKSFDSKFFGPFRVIQSGLQYFEPNASITLFSGTSSTKPEKGTEILAAMNGAVESFARALAVSLSPIRVNCIAPGIIDTPPVLEGLKEESIKNLFDEFTRNLPIQRMGHAEEVAEAVLYLINNQYVTGTTLYVDGGHVIS